MWDQTFDKENLHRNWFENWVKIKTNFAWAGDQAKELLIQTLFSQINSYFGIFEK